jgi:hypothetical protein
MTKEEYKAKIEELNQEATKLDARRMEIKKEYIESNADMSLVDKKVYVEFKDTIGKIHCEILWLGGYEMFNGFKITPIFYKDKKTGGRSLQKRYIYSPIRVLRLATPEDVGEDNDDGVE